MSTLGHGYLSLQKPNSKLDKTGQRSGVGCLGPAAAGAGPGQASWWWRSRYCSARSWIVVLVAGANAKHTTLLGYSLTKGSYHKIFVVGTVVTGVV
jgi:hypothetical protein